MTYKDFPFQECADEAERLVTKHGALVFQKFSCDKCGSRQTIAEANKFYTSGKCEECGHVTDIVKRGCNYLVMLSSSALTNPLTITPTQENN